MKAALIVFVLVVAIFFPQTSVAQTTDNDTTGVIVHADPRIAIVSAALKPRSGSGKGGTIRSGRGFRVQIYNGNDRKKANSIKVDFLSRYPTVPAYMSYIQPQFRVKVGDFRTRGEAQKFAQEINNIYSPVMIVPDIIVINTFKDDQ